MKERKEKTKIGMGVMHRRQHETKKVTFIRKKCAINSGMTSIMNSLV